MSKQINSLQELKELASTDRQLEVFIRLNGNLRSSKDITYNEENGWKILNPIDDVVNTYNNDLEFEVGYPFFFEAMDKGALYKYEN